MGPGFLATAPVLSAVLVTPTAAPSSPTRSPIRTLHLPPTSTDTRNARTFQEMGIDKHLLYCLKKAGFEVPTPIQRAAYGTINSGHTTVLMSQTGAGKTLSYLIPILEPMILAQDNKV